MRPPCRRGLAGTAGLIDLAVYPKSAKVRLTYDPAVVTPNALRESLTGTGFPARTRGEPDAPPAVWRNPKVLTSVASGLLLLAGWLLSVAGAPEPVSLVLYVASLLIGGYYFGREAIEELVFEREIGIELLMSVAAVVATLMGAAAEGRDAGLPLLHQRGRRGLHRGEDSLGHPGADGPGAQDRAACRRDGREQEIPVEERRGRRRLPRQAGPGARHRRRGRRWDVERQPGAGDRRERAGGEGAWAIRCSPAPSTARGALEVRATKAFADNTIARIISMVEEAQERKGTSQRFIERFGGPLQPRGAARRFLDCHPAAAAAGRRWSDWIMRATVFIVAAAPCALVISIPITLVATLGTGARQRRTDQGRHLCRGAGEGAGRGAGQDGHPDPRRTRGDRRSRPRRPTGALTSHEALALAAGIERAASTRWRAPSCAMRRHRDLHRQRWRTSAR